MTRRGADIQAASAADARDELDAAVRERAGGAGWLRVAMGAVHAALALSGALSDIAEAIREGREVD